LGTFVLLSETKAFPEEVKFEIEEALLSCIAADEQIIKRRCLESLGYSSREEVHSLISSAYAAEDEPQKRSALKAMGRSANDRWGIQVMSELNNPDPATRHEAARAAGELELRESVADLIDLLDDVNRDVRSAAIWSLSQIGGSRATQAITDLMDNPEDEEEAQLLQDAADNLAFVNGTRDMLLFDFDELEDSAD
jgi:hypothetical protein